MAFPNKGSRRLVVDGVTYRFIGLFCERDRMDVLGEKNEFRVQLADHPGVVLRGEFGYSRLKAEYERVGKHVSRHIDHVPPFVVRQSISLGLSRGWKPHGRGSEFDLGAIDDQIDWTGLRPAD